MHASLLASFVVFPTLLGQSRTMACGFTLIFSISKHVFAKVVYVTQGQGVSYS